jgi:hypothetical protein
MSAGSVAASLSLSTMVAVIPALEYTHTLHERCRPDEANGDSAALQHLSARKSAARAVVLCHRAPFGPNTMAGYP